MNRKISLGIVISLLCLCAAVASSVTMKVLSNEYNEILQGLPQKLERYEILDELDDIIKENYYGSTEDKDLEQAIAQGYVNGLGDKNCVYMTAESYLEYKSEISGDMYGIGVEYEKDDDGYIEITTVYDGSPAHSSGLKKGDVIVAFDGIRIDANNYDEMAAKLQGDKLTSVNIIYKRGENETNVTIVKGYEAQSVTTNVYESIGYIKISSFYPTTASQLETALNTFLSSGITGIVLDLRDNNSANYQIAIECLDLFVQMSDAERPAATVIDENGNVVSTYVTSSGEVNLPVMVLLSKKTAKAAEIFACNMRDFGKGQLVGEKTKGSCLVQEIFELSTGSAVLLSTGKILPYASESFDGVGVTPDYEVKLTQQTEDIFTDSQFLYAVGLLSEQG